MSDAVSITIAEDHPVFREGLRHILSRDPDVRLLQEADNGRDALAHLRQFLPRVALLDVHLPILDGLEIARIRAQDRLPSEIVFLTMHSEESLFNSALDLDVKGYVLKEAAATDILKAIHAVAAGNRFVSPELTNLVLNRRAASKALHQDRPGLQGLTAAERRVLRLIASDRTTKEIADELDLSPRTVDSHRANICSKLGLRGSHSLLKFAFEHRSQL